MNIAQLSAYHVRIPFRKTIRHASHTRNDTDTLIVCCRLSDGTEGYGEGLPRDYVTGETIDSAWSQLKATDWPTQLGDTCENLRDAIELLNDMQLGEVESNGRDSFGNSVRCALELSVLDAFARVEQVPLSTVTQLVPETAAIRQNAERVRYSAVFTPMGPIPEIVRALKLRYYKFHQTKVKVGVEGINDRAALRRIRLILGSEFDIRIDANEAWRCENVEANLKPLLKFKISALEQPVPHEQVDCLAAVRQRIDIPIMLDESLCSLSDAHRAIERGTCDLFNIRLSKCGGFVNSLRLAATAHRAGLGYQLGAQVGETGILSAAGRHFASSVAGIRYLEGSYDRFLVKERLTQEDLTFGRGGYARALAAPGLGVQVDREALRRVTIREEHIDVTR